MINRMFPSPRLGSGSFTTFLDAAQGKPKKPKNYPKLSAELLSLIVSTDSANLYAVQKSMGLDFITFSQVFLFLMSLGLVQAVGIPGKELLVATPIGKQVAFWQVVLGCHAFTHQ